MEDSKSTIRIQTSLGGDTFDLEGPEGLVQELYREWLAARRATAGPSPGRTNEQENSQGAGVEESVNREALEGVYAQDKNGLISLHFIPDTKKRNADAAVLLLYGYQRLGESPVSATTLMKALRQSGISLTRVDRTLAPYSDLIQTGGQRKGRRYGLTNPGVQHAERLIGGLKGSDA